MVMDSDVFNHLMADFGANMQRISETLFLAQKGELAAPEEEEAVAAAKAKLAEYDLLLKDDRFNDLRRSKVEQRYGEKMARLRGYLKTISERGR